MHRVFLAALAAASLLAGPALAGPPNNLRLYSILNTRATLEIDGDKPFTIDENSVNFYYFSTGEHTFVLTDANGEKVTLTADLENNNMSIGRGRAWWCITTGRRSKDNVLVMVFDTREQCDQMLAVAPAEHDDPSDDDPEDSAPPSGK
ncbi:MAG: hypothetical protein JSR60_14090 [Proteobacteria bacterium]|nr:hypothetical protein [Pseudomonadota bacterium]